MTQHVTRPRIVVIGAGFAGINAAKALAGVAADITVIDRKNHHTFQPLLYQVALAVLSPAEIASPVRTVLRHARNTEVILGEVTGFDLERKLVHLGDVHLGDARVDGLDLPYDYLVVAAGATHAYFGHPEWEEFAPGLKTLEDATEIRRRILMAFETAEREKIGHQVVMPLSFVVVGGGPTGVELAGAISDISKRHLQEDFRAIDPRQSRVILLEGGPRVLPTYPADLSASAERQLKQMGVEVRTSAMVTNIEPGVVSVGKEKIPAAVILWGAGVSASPLGKMLGVPTDKAGRVLVQPDLTVSGHPEVFVTGDLASATRSNGQPVPGVAPAAIQMGKFAARQIKNVLAGKPREKFEYLDKGSLATIGRSHAIAAFPGNIHISGYFAWLSWLFIHLLFLIGFRNRFFVMTEWAWSYITYNHSARLITDPGEEKEVEKPKTKTENLEIKNFTLGYHLVAFIDVLDQRNKFRGLHLPANADEKALVAKVLADTAGHVLRLRRMFKSQFEIFESGITYQGLANQSVHPKFVGFSDSFVMSVPLRNNNGDLIPVVTIYSTMTAASIVMLSSLALKHPLRGGIEVGLATEIGPEEIYGTALEQAYVLESEAAEGPRILIGDSLWTYLNAALTEFKKYQAGMAKACAEITEKIIGFIGVDADGKRILDYLGAVKDLITETEKKHMVLPAYDFVLAEQKRHTESGDEKLIHRYADLRHYFESRLPLLNLPVKN